MGEELKSLLADLQVENRKIPVAHLRYHGKSKTYVVWNVTDTEPILVGDDEVQAVVDTYDVDVYSDGNYTQIVNQIKKILKANNFTWIMDYGEMYDEDTELYHRSMQFEKSRFIINKEE